MAVKQPRIVLLGPPALVDGRESHPLAFSEKMLALLALLVCHVDRPLSRTSLASMLWPDVEEAQARANLRRHFYKLGKALPGAAAEPFILSKNSAQWNREAGYGVDVVDFLDCARHGEHDRAIAAYGGPLCAGSFDEAVLEQRERLQQQYADLLRARIDAARASGDPGKCVALLERLTVLDSLNESWVRELAQARLDAGDRAGARRELTALAARLQSELNVQPDEQTAAMMLRFLEQSGAHTATNLPVENDSFVGRESAMSDLQARLAARRWVTVTGPGGIGKTRLSVHAARSVLREFPDGVWFVDLTPATAWTDALRLIAAALGLANDPAQAVRQFVRERRVLLVLDNLEQIEDGAAQGMDDLLREGSAKLLASSRRRVGGSLEDVFELEPLGVPPSLLAPAQSLHYAAVRLFVERASAVAPSFALSHENVAHVVSIVTRLDGLPLAIELVAARANLLTIEGMAKRLGDLEAFRNKARPTRHQTVTAALQWSYDLLSAREQQLLQRVAVFEGAFDLEAIEAICSDADLPAASIFPVLSELVEASLVVSRRSENREVQRYDVLETVRRYLRALPDGAARALEGAHARYYAAWVEELSAFAEGAREAEYYEPIERESANVHAALRYSIAHDVALAARMVAALYRYWSMRGRLREGWEAARACDADSHLRDLPDLLQGRFYQACGILARDLGEQEPARAYFERALERYRACGEERRESDVYFAQAKLAYVSGECELAIELYERCIELMERFGDEHGRASAIANIGSVSHHLGDLHKADRLYRVALAEYERLGYLRGLAFIYRQLSLVRQNFGDLDEAIALARQSIALSVEIGELDREADAQVLYAAALTEAGRAREALPPLVRALEILAGSENAQFLMLAVEALARTAQAVGANADAVRFRAYSQMMRRTKNLSLWQEYADEIRAHVEQLRELLPKETFAAAWAAGERMTPAALLAAARRIEDESRTVASL